jgi:hypothetical protein
MDDKNRQVSPREGVGVALSSGRKRPVEKALQVRLNQVHTLFHDPSKIEF